MSVQALIASEAIESPKVKAKLQLQAQIHYRLGNVAQAIALYSELFQQHEVGSSGTLHKS